MNDQNSNPHIPARLEGDLRSAFGGLSAAGVPSEVDRAVLAMVGGVAAGAQRRRGKRLVLMGAGVAAAAAVVVMVWVVGPGLGRRSGAGGMGSGTAGGLATGLAGDLNGDGKVDMLDALMLAERLRDGKAGVDVNADGKVDRTDVDALALSAVKLERGSL